MLWEARRTKECLEKRFKEAENELSINTRITEMSFRTKLKERLLFEFPSRYEGRSFSLLNVDIDLLLRHCKKNKVFSVSQIANLKQTPMKLLSSGGSGPRTGTAVPACPVLSQARNLALEPSPGTSIMCNNVKDYRNYEAVKHLWELKGEKFSVDSSSKLQNANSSSNSSEKGEDDVQNAAETLINLSSTSFTLKK